MNNIKLTFYDWVNKILIKIKISKKEAILILILNTIQNFPFLFNMLKFNEEDNFGKIFIRIITLLRPIEIISRLNLNSFIFILLLIFNILFFLLLLFIIVYFIYYYNKRKKYKVFELNSLVKKRIVLVSSKFLIYFNLIFLSPILEILIQPFFCQNNKIYNRFLIESTLNVCSSNLRLILVIFSIVNIIVGCFFSFWSAYFFIENFYNEFNYLARDISSMEIIIILKKISLVLSTLPNIDGSYNIYSILIQLIIQSFEVYHYLNIFTFYSWEISFLFGKINITELIFLIEIFIEIFIGLFINLTLDIYVIWFNLALFYLLSNKFILINFIKLVKSNDYKNKNLFKLEKKYKTIYFFCKYNYNKYNLLINNKNKNLFYPIIGFIEDHINNCIDKECFCYKFLNKNYDIYEKSLNLFYNKNNQLFKTKKGKKIFYENNLMNNEIKNDKELYKFNIIFIKKLIFNNIKWIIKKKTNKCLNLKLFLLNLNFYENENILETSYYIKYFVKNKINLRQNFIIYKLIDSLKLKIDYFNENYEIKNLNNKMNIEKINLKDLIKVEKNYKNIENLIINNINILIEILNNLNLEIIENKKILKMILEYFTTGNSINDIVFNTKNRYNFITINYYFNYIRTISPNIKNIKFLIKILKFINEKTLYLHRK